MGLKFSKADKIEEVRVRQLPSPEDREELAAVLTDEPDVLYYFRVGFCAFPLSMPKHKLTNNLCRMLLPI